MPLHIAFFKSSFVNFICLRGEVEFPTDGTAREFPGLLGNRAGEIPAPTVTVRMGEGGFGFAPLIPHTGRQTFLSSLK